MARDNFPACMAEIFAHEGGFVDHPRDPGGATNMGITIGTLRDWRGAPVTKEDVRSLTKREAETIYRAKYWNPVRGDDLKHGVDLVAFDPAVNSGVRRGAQWLQRALGAAPANISALDNSIPRGVWFNAAAAHVTTGLPPGLGAFSQNYLFHHRRIGDGEIQLMATENSTADADRTLWYRSRTSADWRPWRRIYDWANILGTVGQSGGVPTGAILQRGSNANGEFVRLADGTQVCTMAAEASLAIDTDFLGGFRSAAQTWTYPAAFIAGPAVSVMARNLTAFGAVSANVPGTTTMQWAVTAITSQAAASRSVALTAIGRWF